MEIKEEFIETHKVYDDCYGEDVPRGHYKRYVNIEDLLAFLENNKVENGDDYNEGQLNIILGLEIELEKAIKGDIKK